MKNQPKVSIIVPVYNVEKFLPQCVDSLVNQTLKDIEIILVDDGSSDNCPAICDKYAEQDSRIKVIHKKNDGVGSARNSGMEVATGEYIAFVDSDDYVALNAYQQLYAKALDTQADIIYFTSQRFDVQGNISKDANILKEMRFQTEEDIRKLMLDMVANPPKAKKDRYIAECVWCSLYAHNIIQRHAIRFKNRDEVIEDLMFNLDYLLHASNVVIIPDVYYNWRENDTSYTRTVRPDKIDKCYCYYQYLLDWLKKNNFGFEGYLRATRLFIAYTRVGIRQYMQSSLSKEEKMQWLREVVTKNFWKDVASLFPYKQLPLKYALHFYLIYKRQCRLLYYFSRLNYKTKYTP